MSNKNEMEPLTLELKLTIYEKLAICIPLNTETFIRQSIIFYHNPFKSQLFVNNFMLLIV